MVNITGGCNKCGKLIQSKAFDPVTGEIPILVCTEFTKFTNDCYNRYYSLEALREQKLNKVLRRGLRERIKEWLRL